MVCNTLCTRNLCTYLILSSLSLSPTLSVSLSPLPHLFYFNYTDLISVISAPKTHQGLPASGLLHFLFSLFIMLFPNICMVYSFTNFTSLRACRFSMGPAFLPYVNLNLHSYTNTFYPSSKLFFSLAIIIIYILTQFLSQFIQYLFPKVECKPHKCKILYVFTVTFPSPIRMLVY